MTVPSVTIVVPTLNAVSTIERALESLVKESKSVNASVEILVVEGGSTDGTLDKVSRFPEIKVLKQASKGLAGARNEGISNTASQFVAFCDADDAWAEGSFAKKLEILQSYPEIWAVSGWASFQFVDTDSVGLPIRRRAGERHKGFTPGAALFRRSAFESMPFDEDLTIASDTDWFIRAISRFGEVFHIDHTVLLKGLRPGSLSTDVSLYRTELMLSVQRHIQNHKGGNR